MRTIKGGASLWSTGAAWAANIFSFPGVHRESRIRVGQTFETTNPGAEPHLFSNNCAVDGIRLLAIRIIQWTSTSAIARRNLFQCLFVQNKRLAHPFCHRFGGTVSTVGPNPPVMSTKVACWLAWSKAQRKSCMRSPTVSMHTTSMPAAPQCLCHPSTVGVGRSGDNSSPVDMMAAFKISSDRRVPAVSAAYMGCIIALDVGTRTIGIKLVPKHPRYSHTPLHPIEAKA